MSKQISTNILAIFAGLIGLTSTIAPASASVFDTKIESTANTLVTKGAKAEVTETTSSNFDNLIGTSSDSQIIAKIVDPNQADLPSINQPTEIVQETGELTLGVETNQQEIRAETEADLGVKVGNLAEVGICLKGSASLGSPDNGSFANCSNSTLSQEVPEPGAFGGLAFLGAYLIFRRRKVLDSNN